MKPEFLYLWKVKIGNWGHYYVTTDSRHDVDAAVLMAQDVILEDEWDGETDGDPPPRTEVPVEGLTFVGQVFVRPAETKKRVRGRKIRR